MIADAIREAVDGKDLSAQTMEAAMGEILDGTASPASIAALAIALRMKGESTTELAAAARVLRERCERVRPRAAIIVDTCGTGGDGAGIFNVSTVAAFVVAACGSTVAKHGNRAVSSRAGSADVLEALGVDIDAPPSRMLRCIDDIGIGFSMAPRYHGALRHAAPVRKELGLRTFFNLLGPLVNPAFATHQLVGVYDGRRVAQLAEVLRALGVSRGWVVHGEDGLDEVSPTTDTQVAEFDADGVVVRSTSPREFGLEPVSGASLRGGDAAQNAALARAVLSGDHDARDARTAVVLNAAATLCAIGEERDPRVASERAAEALDSGRARDRLSALVRGSRET